MASSLERGGGDVGAILARLERDHLVSRVVDAAGAGSWIATV